MKSRENDERDYVAHLPVCTGQIISTSFSETLPRAGQESDVFTKTSSSEDGKKVALLPLLFALGAQRCR